MSFDNPYPNRKDKRKPFRGAKAVDSQCRNHGDCPYCRGNRLAKTKREIERIKSLSGEPLLDAEGFEIDN